MLDWEKVRERTSYELIAVLMGVSVAATVWVYGCTPAQDATIATDIQALELPTEADCAYLGGIGPDVDLVCVGVEGLESVLVSVLHSASTYDVPAVTTDAGLNIPHATIFIKVNPTSAATLMAKVHKDGSVQ